MPGYDSVGSLGTASNPFTVNPVGTGQAPAASSQSVVPSTNGPAFPVQVTATYGGPWANLGASANIIANTADGVGRALLVANAIFDSSQNAYRAALGDANGAWAVEKNRSIFYIEAPSQTLAAAAVFTGATRDVGAAAGALCAYPRFGVFVNASQSGTLTIFGSDDNFATSYVVATQAVAAATPIDITVPVRARYHRAVFTNGATAQTSIVIKDGYQA